MAHNINYNSKTNTHSFLSVKEKAWHGLGQIVSKHPTSAEAIKYAGLDFQVAKQKLFTAGNEELKNYFATVRTDTNEILGVVGSKYEVIQNESAFVFFDNLVTDATGIKYETAGALGKGERIFITAKMPDVIRVQRKDEIEKYIFLTTSHDGSGSIMAAFTPVRIVCNNTLNMALQNHSNSVFIKHTANAEEKLKNAARIISISDDISKQLEIIFNKWSRVRISDYELKKLIQLAMSPNQEVFNAVATNDNSFQFSHHFDDICGQAYEYAMSNETQLMQTTAGTLFGAYNSITGYYQNVKNYKSADTRANSILFGTGLERTKKAFELCMRANDFLN